MCLRKYLSCFLILLIITNLFIHSAYASAGLITYQKNQTPEEIGRHLVKNLLDRKGYMLYGEEECLHYAEACTSYSAYRFVGLTGDKELLDELNKRCGVIFDTSKSTLKKPVTLVKMTPRYGYKIERNMLISLKPHVDFAVIGILPLEMFILTGDKESLKLGLDFADRQWQNPRADGLTNQTRWWIDDMYMIGMLQMQAYRATGEMKYADRAALQIAAYLDKLQQPSGLFYHGPEHHFYWGRGNGWVASALTEVLKSLPEDHPKRHLIMNSYLKMMATLLRYQSENGMWRQLIDYEPAWEESSCTAMFTYAMITGIKYGWLEGDDYRLAVQKAWDALCSHLDGEANLSDICAGTGQGDNIEYYLNRPKSSGDLHGQAPLLWCACELLDTTSAVPSAEQIQRDREGDDVMKINVTSYAFADGGMIPSRCTCDGRNISPPLEWDAVPDGTKSIALISDDPDAPMGTWVHWVLFNLPAETRELEENIPPAETLPNGASQGMTDFKKVGYGGPCPPSGTHRYFFKIYALDKKLDLPAGATKGELLRVMEGHILGQGQLIGKYKRK